MKKTLAYWVALLATLALIGAAVAQPKIIMQYETAVITDVGPSAGNEAAGTADSLHIGYVNVTDTDPSYLEGLYSGTGLRKVMPFTITLLNSGDQDWFGPNVLTNPELFIYEAAPGHGHIHLKDWTRFTLYQNNKKVASNQKLGWCVASSTPYFPGFSPLFNQVPVGYSKCEFPSLLKGWGDTYAARARVFVNPDGTPNYVLSGAAGMWFDITGLPDGRYTAEFEVDPLHLYGPYANTRILVPIRITGDVVEVESRLIGKGRFK